MIQKTLFTFSSIKKASIVSNYTILFILQDDTEYSVQFKNIFSYKNLIRYDLFWYPGWTEEDPNTKPSIIIWEPENKAGTTEFTGSEAEFNEWIVPVIDIFVEEYNRQEQEAIDNAEITEATQLLQKYDNAMTVYHDRINLAIINGDTELESSLREEMLAYDPEVNTQSLEDLQHYCKQCGHELDIENICTNTACKRKTLQDNIVTAVEEKEAKQAEVSQK